MKEELFFLFIERVCECCEIWKWEGSVADVACYIFEVLIK